MWCNKVVSGLTDWDDTTAASTNFCW